MRALLLLSVLLVLWTITSAGAQVTRRETQVLSFNVSSPDVVLGPGTDLSVYLVSENETWAEVNVTAGLGYLQNVLDVANQNVAEGCQAELQFASASGINLVSNFTVYFGNGTLSKQLEIVNGVVTQSLGSWYSLACSCSICVFVAVQMNATGSSVIGLKLHVVNHGTVSPLFVQTIVVNVG